MKLFSAVFLAAMLAATPLWARDPANVLMPEDPAMRAAQEHWGYADAVIAGDMIYLSGMVVVPGEGEGGLEKGFEEAFVRIGAILARAGASFDDVVEMTSYHTDILPQVVTMAKVKKSHIKGPPPAWTAVGTTALLDKRGVSEIRITAYKPRKR